MAFLTALWALSTLVHSTPTAPAIAQVPASAWTALNTSVSGRLFAGQPIYLPCFTNYEGSPHAVDLAQCAAIQANKTDSNFIADRFGGYEYSNWAACQSTSQSCALSFAAPDVVRPLVSTCYQGSVPRYYIDVRAVSDVQAGLAFAQKYKVPLVVKNTGHDYKGRSSAPDSLALWTHNLTPPITRNTAFTPASCSSAAGDSITVGAGQGFAGIYDFANANNLHIVGGTSTTVGASGGWVTGGGHSALSPTLGLGVDNALQMRVVLPNGTYTTVSRCQHPEVFFALRGGGGGTYGVITETTFRAHPAQPLQLATFALGTLSPTNAKQLLAVLVANAPRWADEGWGGYAFPGLYTNGISAVTMMTPKLSLAQAKASMQPLSDFVHNISTLSVPLVANVSTIPSYYTFFQQEGAVGLQKDNNVGVALSSRLVPRRVFEDEPGPLVDALAGILAAGQEKSSLPLLPLFICITAPSNYSVPAEDAQGAPGAPAVTPAWRSALWHVIHLREWDPTDPLAGGVGSVDAAMAAAHAAMDPLRALSPDGGAYLNEADPFETDPAGSFWGQQNYQRLLALKAQLDPSNVLTNHQAVGWDVSQERYRCYPKDPNT